MPMNKNILLVIFALLLIVGQTAIAHAQSATYRVTFEGKWTTSVTPGGVPGGAHFTTLIGAVHNDQVTFWSSGGTASAGIESMAEIGGTSTLKSEITAAGSNAHATIEKSISSGGTATATVDITVTPTHPLVTLVTMVAPSPDWFVGVSRLSLRDSNNWIASKTVDLFPYDAGTEDGTEFSLSNDPTSPQGMIMSIKGTGKFSDEPIATLTFTLQTPPPPPGGGSSGGGGSSRDDHGNTPARATVVSLGETAPWSSSTAGQINTTRDIDYFTFTAPHAGVLLVGTIGSTDTRGTVWQDGEELDMADSGGTRQNFRLSVRVEAGPVVIAVAGNGRRTGSYTLQTSLLAGYLENPGPESFQSGVGVLSGWVCDAEEIEIEIGDLTTQVAAYGTERLDTVDSCGDTNNGFGLLYNWNHLDDGEHTVLARVNGVELGRATVDGVELGRATVTVTTLGAEFLEDVAGECTVENFPMDGETVRLVWQQTNQNFMIAGESVPRGENRAGLAGVGYLENPGPNSFQSGLGVISGWVCDAETVEIELGNLDRQVAAYGTERLDTVDSCGDTNNGFGLLFNWNRLGDGEHTVVAYIDNSELGRATVRVTTVGEGAEEEFLRGVEGECVMDDFPSPGERVTVEWQQNNQNFVIISHDPDTAGP